MSLELVKSDMRAAIWPDQNKDEKLPVKIRSVHPNLTAKLTQNVMASGAVVYDSKVVLPAEVTCEIVLERSNPKFDDVVAKLKEMWERKAYDDNSFSKIRTKDGVLYKNMALESCPHMEDVEHYDTFIYQLRFREYVFVDGTNYSPSAKTDG